LPDETRIDLLAGYEAVAWRTQLNLRNVTDEETYTPFSGFLFPV